MNGRVYDCNFGRFLSVDPFIQSPSSTQSINAYSYIMNNPMAGTDPTGYKSESQSCSTGTNTNRNAIGCTVVVNNGSGKKKQSTVQTTTTNGALNKNGQKFDRKGHDELGRVDSSTNQSQMFHSHLLLLGLQLALQRMLQMKQKNYRKRVNFNIQTEVLKSLYFKEINMQVTLLKK
jgi:hypothetical protein